MDLQGLGVDIVETGRIRKIIDNQGDRFLERYFTAGEIEYCRRKARSFDCFAGRFASKEAVYKALRLKWVKGFRWKDIEILPRKQDAPKIMLTGRARERARELGIGEIILSISHCREYAIAVAAVNRGGD